jgi:hypothetical protein
MAGAHSPTRLGLELYTRDLLLEPNTMDTLAQMRRTAQRITDMFLRELRVELPTTEGSGSASVRIEVDRAPMERAIEQEWDRQREAGTAYDARGTLHVVMATLAVLGGVVEPSAGRGFSVCVKGE